MALFPCPNCGWMLKEGEAVCNMCGVSTGRRAPAPPSPDPPGPFLWIPPPQPPARPWGDPTIPWDPAIPWHQVTPGISASSAAQLQEFFAGCTSAEVSDSWSSSSPTVIARDPASLLALGDCLTIHPDLPHPPPCFCLGEIRIRLEGRSGTLTLGLHLNGTLLIMEWGSRPQLRDPTRILHWLAARGVTAPLQRYQTPPPPPDPGWPPPPVPPPPVPPPPVPPPPVPPPPVPPPPVPPPPVPPPPVPPRTLQDEYPAPPRTPGAARYIQSPPQRLQRAPADPAAPRPFPVDPSWQEERRAVRELAMMLDNLLLQCTAVGVLSIREFEGYPVHRDDLESIEGLRLCLELALNSEVIYLARHPGRPPVCDVRMEIDTPGARTTLDLYHLDHGGTLLIEAWGVWLTLRHPYPIMNWLREHGVTWPARHYDLP